MKNLLKAIYGKIVYILILKNHINYSKTILINFLTLPFKQAIKLPIIIYGPCKLASVSGSIILNCPVQHGIIKIGKSDPPRSYSSQSYIAVYGKLEFQGKSIIRRGSSIHINKTGHLLIGKNVTIGCNVSIRCEEKIVIGEATSIGNNSIFMDTDFHYTINTLSREIKKNTAPIEIGKNNWMGSWCTIKKGAKTPKGTIIAGPFSMIGKDYTNKIPEYSIIAGSPAKLIVENIRRINNINSEYLVKEKLKNSNNYILPEEYDIEAFCTPQEFIL